MKNNNLVLTLNKYQAKKLGLKENTKFKVVKNTEILIEMSYLDLKTIDDVNTYMEIKSKEYGNKNNFLSSQEYGKAYIIIKGIFDKERKTKKDINKKGIIVFFGSDYHEAENRNKFAFILNMYGENFGFLADGVGKTNMLTTGDKLVFRNERELESYLKKIGYVAINNKPISITNKKEIKKLLASLGKLK